MNLKEKLDQDMKAALKNKESLKLSVIRMAKAAIKNTEIDKRRELNHEEVLEVLSREVKKRKEAIEEFKKGNRQDLVSKEENELKILMDYLPSQLSEEEIRGLLQEALSSFDPQEKIDLGKIMAKVMPQIKGRADGRLVNQVARELLIP